MQLLTALIVAFIPSMVLAGGFASSCHSYALTINNNPNYAILDAYYNGVNGNRQHSSTDLNYCIANINGGLNVSFPSPVIQFPSLLEIFS